MGNGGVHRETILSLWITSLLGVLGSNVCLTTPAFAQLIPDDTLGQESSIVTPELIQGLPATLVEGGAERGANLFHSFTEFNVNTGQQVYFANPAGIDNILTRVTGSNVSNIDGLLGVDGNAHLFLLNPNGVIFGPNARLDVNGSFTTSTAISFAFADGGEFSATPTGNELLSVSVPLGVQFNDQPQGSITHQGDLAVGLGQSLTLLGDTVTSEGALTATAGTVQVLGNQIMLSDQAAIDVSGTTGGGTVRVGGDYQGNGMIPNAQQTRIASGANIWADAGASGDGGSVIVWADGITEFGGTISARGGIQGGDGGFIETSGAAALMIQNTAQVDTHAVHGQTGTWLLDPVELTINDTGATAITGNPGTNTPNTATTIGADTIETALDSTAVILQADELITVAADIEADSGNDLTLQAAKIAMESVTLEQEGSGAVILTTLPNNQGEVLIEESDIEAGGGIRIQSSQVLLDEASSLTAINGADIQIEAEQVFIDNESELNARSGGDIVIEAQQVTIQNRSELRTAVNIGDTENGGSIRITANRVFLRSESEISALTSGSGDAGFIAIEAAEQLVLEDAAAITSAVRSAGTGDSRGIQITTNNLAIKEGSIIRGSTENTGSAGDIVIEPMDGNVAMTITLSGSDSTIAASTSGAASGGNIVIRTPGDLVINGDQPPGGLTKLTVESTETDSGLAGTLSIFTNSVVLDRVELSAETASEEGGGTIRFNTSGIALRRGSLINAQSTNTNVTAGDGGNIVIDTDFLVAPFDEDNDILANAESGNGGQITINALSVLGFVQRDEFLDNLRGNSVNDISATSRSGDDGAIALNTLDIDPSQGLAELPTNLADRANQIARGCGVGNTDTGGEFIVTGAGGLPPDASDLSVTDGLNIPWVTPEAAASTPNKISPQQTENSSSLVEAQSMTIDAEGNVYFVTTVIGEGRANSSLSNAVVCAMRETKS
ncbi:MAG: filamentous hemagglutinin N-terminal domain-containing protein [Cyanobacteria bacterium J06638_28]